MAKKTINGIVIFCLDPRPETANLWKHIKQYLIPPEERWAPVGLLGAPVALARPADFPIKFAAAMEDIEFALKEFADGKFIIVGHDCGIYGRLLPREFSLADKQADIAKAADFLRERFSGMPVSAHFKKAGPGFDRIS